VELGLAVFYFSQVDQIWEVGVLTRAVVIGIWGLCCLVIVLYLLRFFRAWPGAARAAFAALFLGFGSYLASGIAGRPLGILEIVVPPPPIHGTTMPGALAEAQRRRLPLFVEFTGVT